VPHSARRADAHYDRDDDENTLALLECRARPLRSAAGEGLLPPPLLLLR